MQSAEFGVHAARHRDGIVVRLRGELDLASAPALREALASVDAVLPVVLDLSELSFIDSCGLSELVAFHLRRPAATLRGAHGAVAKTLAVSGIDQLFDGGGGSLPAS